MTEQSTVLTTVLKSAESYCSLKCQKNHEQPHKADCKAPQAQQTWVPAWVREGRKPKFDDAKSFLGPGWEKSLNDTWANVPAVDVLNLTGNEGAGCDLNLAVCFAAPNSFANMVKTIKELPSAFKGQPTITFSSSDMYAVTRNFITLMFLIKIDNAAAAADAVMHLQYSTRIKPVHRSYLERFVFSALNDVVKKTKNKPADVLQVKSFQMSHGTLRVALWKAQWQKMQAIVKKVCEPETADASRRATTMGNQDRIDRELYLTRVQLHRRVSKLKFRESGVLLEHGASQDDFNVVNPTMFDSKGRYLLSDGFEPLKDWHPQDVEDHYYKSGGHLPENDLYGQLKSYLLNVITTAHQKLRQHKVTCTIYGVDLKSIHTVLPTVRFDRIDVSHAVDNTHLGTGPVLKATRPLLNTANPHATVVALYLSALEEVETYKRLQWRPDGSPDTPLVIYLRITKATGKDDEQLMLYNLGKRMYAPVDKWFGEYLETNRYKIGDVAQKEGMSMREHNTVVARNPLRLRKGWQLGGQEEFDLMFAAGLSGFETYVESVLDDKARD